MWQTTASLTIWIMKKKFRIWFKNISMPTLTLEKKLHSLCSRANYSFLLTWRRISCFSNFWRLKSDLSSRCSSRIYMLTQISSLELGDCRDDSGFSLKMDYWSAIRWVFYGQTQDNSAANHYKIAWGAERRRQALEIYQIQKNNFDVVDGCQ